MAKRKASVNYIYNMLYQVLTFLTPIITAPFLARTLGATNLGIYDYTYTIMNWFIIIGMVGISLYGNKEIARASATNDRTTLSKTFSQIFTLQMINVLISFVIYMLLFFFTNFEYKEIFLVQGILIFANAFEISWFYAGMQDFKKVSIRNIIVKLISVLGIIILIRSKEDMMLYTAFFAVVSLVNSAILFKNIGDYIDYKMPPLKEIYQHLKGSIALFIPQIATTIYCVFSRTLIGILYEGIDEVAFYNYAYRFTTMVLYVVTAIGTVMLPRVVEIRSRGNEKEACDLTNKTLKVALFISIPLAIGFSCVAPFFIPWFLTEDFTRVGYTICLLSPIIIAISITNVLGLQYLIPFDKTKKYTISVFAGCAISLIFNLILIKPFGAYGAAVTAVITETTVLIVQYLFTRKDFNFSGILRKFFRYLIISLIMGSVTLSIGLWLGIGIITNIIQCICGVTLYILIMFIIKDDISIFLLDKFKQLFIKKNS